MRWAARSVIPIRSPISRSVSPGSSAMQSSSWPWLVRNVHRGVILAIENPAARELYERIVAASKPEDAMEAFREAVCTDAQEETHVVLKAADQISRLAALNAWQPTAKKILIVRDGRDAAISAAHFEEWLRAAKPTRGSPPVVDYWGLLHNWADQADKAIAAAGRRQDLSPPLRRPVGGLRRDDATIVAVARAS